MRRRPWISYDKKCGIVHINTPNLSSKKLLVLILLFALFLRLYFFIGLTNCQSQDDGLYLANAERIISGTFRYNSYLLYQPTLNPVFIPSLRTLMIYSTAFFIKTFGVNDISSVMFPLLTSLFSIILIFHLGKMFFTKRVGLIAAFLLSIFPLDIIYSTRIMPDIPMSFFMGFSVFFFFKGVMVKKLQKKILYYSLSGLSLGIAYLIKEMALVVFVFYFVYILYKRRFDKNMVFVLLLFILIFEIELLFFSVQTGDPLYRWDILSKAHLGKGLQEWTNNKEINLGILHILYPRNYNFFYHTKNLFSGYIKPNINYFGYFYVLLLVALCYNLVKRNKNSYPIILWFIILFLFIEFGFTDVSFVVENGKPMINYMMIFKESDSSKFTTILTFPSLLLLASFIGLYGKKFRYTPIILLLLLLVSSLYLTYKTSEYFNDGMKDVRLAYQYLKKQPEKNIYSDYLAVGQLSYYFGWERNHLFYNIENVRNISTIKDSYVIVGGARGCDISGSFVLNRVPDTIRNELKKWKIVKIINGKMAKYRYLKMKIYYVP